MASSGGIGVRWGRSCWLIAITLLWVTRSLADGGRPQVSRVELSRSRGLIAADITMENLFPDKISATLNSGLPVVIDLALELRSESAGGQPPVGHLIRTEITYDVWDDIYLLERGGESAIFTERSDLISACLRLRNLPLIPFDRYPTGSLVGLSCRVAVNPLSGEDRERMADWLAQTVSGQDDLSSREVRLDLGALVNGFFRGGEVSAAWGPEINFGPFDLSTLREVDHGDPPQRDGESP